MKRKGCSLSFSVMATVVCLLVLQLKLYISLLGSFSLMKLSLSLTDLIDEPSRALCSKEMVRHLTVAT